MKVTVGAMLAVSAVIWMIFRHRFTLRLWVRYIKVKIRGRPSVAKYDSDDEDVP
jgi:hypothetical protein